MQEANRGFSYQGEKEMLLVNSLEDKEFLRELFVTMYDELHEMKKRKR